MVRLPVVILAGFLFVWFPCRADATDWVYKGQPKDGIEHYQSSAVQDASRAQRLKLLADCDKSMQMLASPASTGMSADPQVRKSVMLGCSSCGLIYGVDHQQERAVACLDRGLELAKLSRDDIAQAQILNYFGIVHALWGQLPKALDYHRRALAISKAGKDFENQVTAYNQIGQIAMFMGDYRASSDALEQSLTLQTKTVETPQTCLTFDNLGQLNEAWGGYKKALECYRKSLELKKKLGSTGGQAASHVFLGRLYKLLGKDEDALASFQEGLKICEKYGYPVDLVIDHMGNLFLDRGDTQRAREYIERAGYWQSLGRYYLMTGELPLAETNYLKLQKYSDPRRIADYLWVAHTGLGLIREQQGDLPSAADHFRTAIGHTESIRMGLTQSERAEYFNVQSGGFFRTAPYKGLARVLIKMNKPSDAFRESEFTKARTFAEALARLSATTTMDLPAEVMATDTALNLRLVAANKALRTAYDQDDRGKISILEAEAESAKDKLAAHVSSLRSRFPLFASTRYPAPMSLDQAALGGDEWILAYDVTDTGIITYLLKGPKVVKADFSPTSRREIDSLIKQFREPLEIESSDSLVDKLLRFDFGAGKKLSDILLHGILSDLPEHVPLIVVPDGSLGVLPFEMLVLNEGGTLKPGKRVTTVTGAEFFGDRNPIAYYQSVTALTLSRTLRKKSTNADRLLVMADPVFQMKDQRARLAKPTTIGAADKRFFSGLMATMEDPSGGGLKFTRLELTGALAKQLCEQYEGKADSFTALDASKDSLLKQCVPQMDRYESIVFATHGYLGSTVPGFMEPILVLSLVPQGTDGFLRMSEVMHLRLASDVVALTACQTGLGKDVSGEGVMSMGRAFQYAGARTVLMSLWSVAEKSSVVLVESFFRHLKQGKSKLESLKLAREEIRKQGYDHPFFWAPFIIVGEVD